MSRRNSQPSRSQTLLVGLLLLLLIVGSYVIGFIGWGSPKTKIPTCTPPISGGNALGVSSDPTFIQCGGDTITILAGSNTGQVQETFSPPFETRPLTSYILTCCGTSSNPTSTEYHISFLADNGTIVNGVSVITITTSQTVLFAHPIYRGIDVANIIPLTVQLQGDIISKTGTTPTLWVQGYDCTIATWEPLGNTAKTPGFNVLGANYIVGAAVAINGTLWANMNGCATGAFISGQLTEGQLRIVGQTSVLTSTLKISSLSLVYTYNFPPVVLQGDLISDNDFHALLINAFGLPGTYPVLWTASEG